MWANENYKNQYATLTDQQQKSLLTLCVFLCKYCDTLKQLPSDTSLSISVLNPDRVHELRGKYNDLDSSEMGQNLNLIM